MCAFVVSTVWCFVTQQSKYYNVPSLTIERFAKRKATENLNTLPSIVLITSL